MAQNEADLQRLAVLLAKGKPLTAKKISQMTSCSRPVAYARIEALKDRGYKFIEQRVREGSSGPMSTAYSLQKGR